MKGVQCYELFGGIALKNHTFSFFHFHIMVHSIKCFLFKSINFARVEHSASRDDNIFSVKSTRAVGIDLLCLKPF